MTEEEFISAERLEKYKGLTVSTETAIILHNQTLRLGASLMSMIAMIELALRNSTNEACIQHFQNENWLTDDATASTLLNGERDQLRSAKSHAQRAIYAKMNFREKAALDDIAFPNGIPQDIADGKRKKKRQETISVTHGQVIAQTTIAFWKRLYSSDYENTLWKPCLKRIFPNKGITRNQISKQLEKIYAVRNRVAHHEPVYGRKLDDAMNAISFIRRTLGNKTLEENSAFTSFSKILYLRLRMDYEIYKETWAITTTIVNSPQ